MLMCGGISVEGGGDTGLGYVVIASCLVLFLAVLLGHFAFIN